MRVRLRVLEELRLTLVRKLELVMWVGVQHLAR